MLNQEFADFLSDAGKEITADIVWKPSEAHPAIVGFRVDLSTTEGHPVEVVGSFNRRINALTFAVIHTKFGRIYALDIGKDHKNPDGNFVGELHKHRWTEAYEAQEAYVPDDITEPASNPVAVWRQFCIEAKIIHTGKIANPPQLHTELQQWSPKS
jgi:hypothetical protein